jgi:L-fucose mutarotase
MLHNIDTRITPELLYILSQMGHGDEIVVADRNFPSYSIGSNCIVKVPIILTNLNATETVEAICSLLPLDTFSDYGALRMEVDNEPASKNEVHQEVWLLLNRIGADQKITIQKSSLERQDFYSHASSSYAIVQTNESRPFGCFILRKGVIFSKRY